MRGCGDRDVMPSARIPSMTIETCRYSSPSSGAYRVSGSSHHDSALADVALTVVPAFVPSPMTVVVTCAGASTSSMRNVTE